MENSHKFCKDCRWACPARRGILGLFERDFPWAYAKCANPFSHTDRRLSSSAEFLVTGEPQVFCSSARYPDEPCGPEGKLWEPKP